MSISVNTTANYSRADQQVESVNYAQNEQRTGAARRIQGNQQAQETARILNDQHAKSVEGARSGQHAKAALRYLAATLTCTLFAFIYAQFSHGVYSPFMTFMFAIPLLGGALPAFIRHLMGAGETPLATRQAWALAIAALTVGSCLQGVFSIAGTGSMLLIVYPIAAAVFAIAALVTLASSRR